VGVLYLCSANKTQTMTRTNPTKPVGLKRVVTYLTQKQRTVVDIDTGETAVQLPLARPIEVVSDSNPYTKVYTDFWQLMASLNGAGLKMLAYVGQNLIPGKDYIELTREAYMKDTGLSSLTMYYKGIKALTDAKVLFPSNLQSVYYINVNVLFNGDRTKLAERKKAKRG